jgi:hypothetical protein
MTNALRSSIVFHRLALKISKELSLDRDTRSTGGQLFLNECFAEFTTSVEQGNPIEKKMLNHLRFNQTEDDVDSKSSLGSIARQLVNLGRSGGNSPTGSDRTFDGEQVV